MIHGDRELAGQRELLMLALAAVARLATDGGAARAFAEYFELLALRAGEQLDRVARGEAELDEVASANLVDLAGTLAQVASIFDSVREAGQALEKLLGIKVVLGLAPAVS